MSLIPQLLREIYQPLSSTNAAVAPPMDWKETADAHVIKADLPGLKKEEVKVSVEDGGKILQISGERAEEKGEDENKSDKWHRVERPRGEFRRRFYLPANAKTDEVNAAMENGVLTITIPKQEIKKPGVKKIEITTN